jgi:Flp pilus assembly protein TadD
MAGLCILVAGYLYLVGRGRRPQTPDPAAILDEALRVAAIGATGRGLALLDEALRLDAGLWQAWEYRGRIHLSQPDGTAAALEDFTQAIRLAPNEPHLYILRSQVLTRLGRESAARADVEAAARLDAGNDARLDPM